MASRVLGLVFAVVLVACVPTDDDVAGPPPSGYVGTTPLRRLSNVEYLRSMAALFPSVTPASLPALPPDSIVEGFENDAASLGPSDVHIARYEQIAFTYTQLATADDAALARVLPCTSWVSAADQDACGRALVLAFGRRAFRRPPTADEIETLATRFTAFRTSIDFPAAVQLTLMALVQSPSFLYRIEIPSIDATAPNAPIAVPVDDYALASRLSFLLWQSGPDDELLDLAAGGELSAPGTLRAEVDRMLADPRVIDTIVDFHRQWLDFDRILSLANRVRDPAQYPTWTTDVQNAEHEEVERFVRWSMTSGEGTLGELFTSRHAFVNASMAAVYGVSAPSDGSWVEVDLPAGQRAGVLTRAAFLAGRSHPGSISPPVRGNYVLERVLCQPHQMPPAAADLSPPQPMMGEGPVTDRVLFERRTASVACAGCHDRIDGVGFAFEHYDAIGAYHDLDQGLPIDASGELSGVDPSGPFTDAIDLSTRLATSSTVATCASDTWVRFALGRLLEHEDHYLRYAVTRAWGSSGGTIREVLRTIALSPELRMQRTAQE
jgi:hypothetical protein